MGARGYAFAQVRPLGTRDPATHTVNLGYVVDEGPRVYIERINVRGNTRTRDYVVRREFDLGEGDAYNKVLIDRAERRLNNLGFFKKVRITNEPGSTPDRVVVNVDVEDQPTGSFSISGGYSTSDGFIGEVSVSESNFLGRGQFVRCAARSASARTASISPSPSPISSGTQVAAGFDLFSKYQDNTRLLALRAAHDRRPAAPRPPDHGRLSFVTRYSLYYDRDRDPEHDDAALQRLLDPDPRASPRSTRPARSTCTAAPPTAKPRSRSRKSQGTTLTSASG